MKGITTLGLVALTTLALATGCAPAAEDDDAADQTDGTDPPAQTDQTGQADPADQGGQPHEDMTFFITSAGPGNGADLGGLDGADAHCQSLAGDVGAGDRTWRAYLSTTGEDGEGAVDARDRIGTGPWHNHAGELIANDVDHLHSDDANLTKESILTETGVMVNGRGDSPNEHDILTGSTLDGRALEGDEDTTCSDWTSSGEGSARVGHHDRTGGGENPESWNSAHGSRGCSQADLQGTGGNGYFYCFAAGRSGA